MSLKRIEELTVEVEELKLALRIKQQELERLIKENTPTIEEKIKECEDHGFTVKRNRTWLWLCKTDGRYHTTITGKPTGIEMELIDKSKEDKILEKIGFKFSSTRGNWYYIGE
ncbi:hypothetical protein ABE073_04255 [Lederbergia citrisecunda]|uniref:hypothetical protein n=1 Tax=Lederbergia citrisecunda TaxID=2833583 RepID=UPI003D2E29A3